MHRTATAIALLALLLAASACGGSAGTASQPGPATPTSVASAAAGPTPAPTANPAQVIFEHSQSVMINLTYTVRRQWLKPQVQAIAPTSWKPGQVPETTVVAIDSPVYSLSSTTDTSPHCPNAICYVVRVTGTQHGSSPTCTPVVRIATEVYVDGSSFRNLSRHVLGSGGGSGCQPVDLEGWDSISFP